MNNMIRQCKRALLLLTLVSLPCVAFTKVPEVPQDKPKWRIGVTAPSFYPIYVSKAYGVNEEEDWTSLLFNHTAVLRRISLANIQGLLSDYDGFGIALNPIAIDFPYQIGGTNHLPDSIYVYWTSMHDLKFYVTKFDLSNKVKALMMKKKSYRYAGSDIPCYINDFSLGMLPNGHVKVWLSGCLEYIYVGELAPFKIMQQDYNGFKASDLASSQQVAVRAQKQAETLGHKVFPIPWDKVNKTYWRKDITHVYSLDDYNDQGDLINPKPEPVIPKPKPITNRCWKDKQPERTSRVKWDRASPQYELQRILWNYAPELLKQVIQAGNDEDAAIIEAWQEAKQKGLNDDLAQIWVISRLVGLTNYSVETVSKELKIKPEGIRTLKQNLTEMCQ